MSGGWRVLAVFAVKIGTDFVMGFILRCRLFRSNDELYESSRGNKVDGLPRAASNFGPMLSHFAR